MINLDSQARNMDCLTIFNVCEGSRGKRMKEVLNYLKPYKKFAILAPIMMLLEVAAELSMPKIMTYLIDIGVGSGDTGLIIKIGIMMLVISVIGLVFGFIEFLKIKENKAKFEKELQEKEEELKNETEDDLCLNSKK